ncbi:tetratricopeptide repeat protein [Fluviicola sp.]|uniref:tetratricopeptide repeat protein n=1 Tax=Fluviicola sp. TaxID=1917219 RepID=UPI0031D0EBDC
MRHLLMILLITPFGAVFAQNEVYYNHVFDSVSKSDKQKEGIAYFESELKKYPKNELLLRSVGALNMQLGNLKETTTYYNKALAVNPGCATCYFFLAQAAANGNDFSGAYAFLEKGIALDPKDASFYLMRGKIKLFQGNEISGLNDLSKAILLEPENAGYYLERADYYLRKQNYFSAKADLLKAQKADPKRLITYNKLAEVYTYEHDFETALAFINKALTMDSVNVESLMTRGAVYSSREDENSALKDFERATRLEPLNYMAHYYLAQSYYGLEKMDDFCREVSESIRLIEEQKINDPDFYRYALAHRNDVCNDTVSSYYYQRGIAAFNTQDYQKAIEWYDQAIEKFPTEYMTYSFKGNAELFLGESRKAITDYQKSLNKLEEVGSEMLKNPKYTNGVSKDSLEVLKKAFGSSTNISLAFCYFNLGNTDSALTCVDLSIQNDPGIADFAAGDSYFMKGILLLDKGRFAEAEKVFRMAAERSPDWSGCEDYMALSLIAQTQKNPLTRNELQIRELKDLGELHWNLPLKTGKGTVYLEEALKHLEIALRVNPQDALALYLRAYVNRQTGKDACGDFVKANQLGYPVELIYLKACSK